jgi:chromosome segregation ATPase
MINETAKHISQLVEINRALAEDLDVSRRFVADLGRERDSLTKQVKELKVARQHAVSNDSGIVEKMRYEVGHMRQNLKKSQGEIDILVSERDEILRTADIAINRADTADEYLRDLLAKYHEVEKDRDAYRMIVQGSSSAIEELRHRLSASPSW